MSSEFSSVPKESARALKAPRSQDALEDRLEGTDRLIALSGIRVRDPFIVDRRPTHPSVRPARRRFSNPTSSVRPLIYPQPPPTQRRSPPFPLPSFIALAGHQDSRAAIFAYVE